MFLVLLFVKCDEPNEGFLFQTKEISNPVNYGGEPNLFQVHDSMVIMSWVSYVNDTTDALLFSRLDNNVWDSPVEIARGHDWFVNWADFPSIISFDSTGTNLAAHWLQKSDEGTYDYDVMVSVSNDNGNSWSSPFTPHDDGIASEHGFVSMLPFSRDSSYIVWLDGRNTKTVIDSINNTKGAMALWGGVFTSDGRMAWAKELDNRVCDCCQTDLVVGGNNTFALFRDRSFDEIRDISFATLSKTNRPEIHKAFSDNWLISGCPVNGPASISIDDKILVANYAAPDNNTRINLTLIDTKTKETILLDSLKYDGILGRLDLAKNGDNILLSWIEEKDDFAYVMINSMSPENLKILKPEKVAKVSSSRASGFPRVIAYKDGFLVAWIDNQKVKTIKTTMINI